MQAPAGESGKGGRSDWSPERHIRRRRDGSCSTRTTSRAAHPASAPGNAFGGCQWGRGGGSAGAGAGASSLALSLPFRSNSRSSRNSSRWRRDQPSFHAHGHSQRVLSLQSRQTHQPHARGCFSCWSVIYYQNLRGTLLKSPLYKQSKNTAMPTRAGGPPDAGSYVTVTPTVDEESRPGSLASARTSRSLTCARKSTALP